MTQETAVEISDEVVKVAREAWQSVMGYGEGRSSMYDVAMRSSLQAAIPLLVEGLVGRGYRESNYEDTPDFRYAQGLDMGWNARSKNILSKVKK